MRSSQKPKATQSAMFLATIEDNVIKVCNIFEYSLAIENKKLSVIVKKFKACCTPQKKVIF